MAICFVCKKHIGFFSVETYEDSQGEIKFHDTCYEEFMKQKEKYLSERIPIMKWEKSLPAKKRPPRPSLTSILAKKTGETLKEKAIQSVVMAKNAAKTSKSIFKEADKRVGKIEDIRTEEDAYEFAAKEVEEESYKKGLWAKAFSDAEGNEKKQAALYIKYRADQLIQFLEELE
jgi:hypothetical protein